MEFRKVLVVASVLGLAAFAQGCGNACDDYVSAFEAKYEECGIDIPTGGTDGDGECTDEAATLAECLTPCIENASCGALDGSDLDALATYGECATACISG